MKGCVFVKKFLSRSIPVFLAALILVGSLAVPALAAELPPDFAVIPEDCYITGVWSFDLAAAPFDTPTWVHGDFVYNEEHYDMLYISNYSISFLRQLSDQGFYECAVRDKSGAWLSSVFQFEIVGESYCTDEFYSWFISSTHVFVGPLAASLEGDSIFSVFGDISGWIVSSIGTVMPMFYTEASGLTFVGTLAVAGLAFAVFFLIFALIRRFMHFGG